MGHGLRHPTDLEAWRRWQDGRHHVRHVLRSARGRVRPGAAPIADLLGDPSADLLVAVEATHASVAHAVAAVLPHLPTERVAVLCPPGWTPPPAYAGHGRRSIDLTAFDLGPGPAATLAAGHYTEIGAAAHRATGRRPFVVSQHGLLTPHAPPLPRGAHLAAWSDADAGFWASGRGDVSSISVGSQLFWGVEPVEPDPAARPVFLGQLHGAELPRRLLTRAAAEFCLRHDAVYRPHPSERDALSRLQHRVWERRGVVVDHDPAPLRETTAPVVSVFSTGVLEAAARGLPAWVSCPDPPRWLDEFWDRHSMRLYGGDPTPAPSPPTVEPAGRIARLLVELAG